MDKKIKKKVLIVVVVVVIFFAIGTLYFILSQSQEDTYEFINETGGYRLILPTDWKNMIDKSDYSTFLRSDEKDMQHIELDIYKDIGNLSYHKNMVLDTFNESDPNQSISHHQTKINGLEAYVFIITGKEVGEDYSWIINIILIPDGENCFDITFTGDPASFYYEHENEVNQIINSFTIINQD